MNNNRSYILLIVIVALATTTTTFVNAKTSIFKPSDLKFKDLVKKYGVKKVVQAHNLRHRAIVHGEKPVAAQETKALSLLEVAAKTRAQTKITSKHKRVGQQSHFFTKHICSECYSSHVEMSGEVPNVVCKAREAEIIRCCLRMYLTN